MADHTVKGFAPFDLYSYNPSQPAAFAYMALFGIAAILHLVALVPYRSWFSIPLIIGSGMETAAYCFRAQSHDDVRRTLPFLVQNLLLLAAPPFIAASIYMSPRRLARALGAEDHVVAPRLLTKLFVLTDAVCFATQVSGAIMSSSQQAVEAGAGRRVVVAGLVLQIAAFGLFVAWTAVFHSRLASVDASGGGGGAAGLLLSSVMHWQRFVYGLYASSLLFVVRNIARLVEYSEGPGHKMLDSEGYLYALESTTILLIVVVFLVLHPGKLRMRARKYAQKGVEDPASATTTTMT